MYNKIINEGLVTSSLAEILFGTGYKRMGRLMSSMLPKTMHEVCTFYSALVQAYVIGIAQKKGVKICELKEYAPVVDAVSKLWTEGRSIDDKKIFSFINICANNEDIVKKEAVAIIGEWGAFYSEMMDSDVNKIDFYLEPEQFIDLLRALPLLSQTQIDKKTNKLLINNGKYNIECRYSPYLAFYEYNKDLEQDCISRKVTEHCYVLSSVIPGERDGELRFLYTKINSSEKVALQSKETIKVYESENLILICKSLGIKVEWCESSFYGDFAFIKNLADIVNESLLKVLDLDSPQRSASDIRAKLRALFAGTTLDGIVPENKPIVPDRVKMFIYELFITQGIFKTIYCLMLAVEGGFTKEDSARIFNAMMLAFKRKGVINEKEYTDKIALCNEQIDGHIFKLKKIVQKNSRAYRLRESEIYAEQRTICILHTAGIKNDKIVADAEEILSIDDFYDMFNNPETPINEDLSTLLSLLCCFYGALLQNEVPFNSEKYYKDVYKLRKTYGEEQSVEMLFEGFVEIVKKSKGNEIISKLIGRECICDMVKLEGFKRKILELKEENEDIFSRFVNVSNDFSSKYGKDNVPGMFISYCRDDNPANDPKIERFAEYYRNLGINVFFDTSSIDSGDGWMERVHDFITDERTAMVVAFVSKTSVLRKSVEFEIKTAHEESIRRFPGDGKEDRDGRNHFILAVNLEEENIEDFLDEMWTAPGYSDIERKRISKYSEVIAPKTFRRINEKDKILQNFRDNVAKNKAHKTPEISEFSAGISDNIRLQIKNFLCFLKYGEHYQWHEYEEVDNYFNDDQVDTSYCIFPMLASVRETRIKRDNITVIGYEIINGKGRANKTSNYILSSKKLAVEEYYCVPNYKTVGENCSWMVEPLLVSHDKFVDKNEGK